MQTSTPLYATREEWLTAAVNELRPLFQAYAPAPAAARIRVACGFPSSWKRSKALGECWIDTASADQTNEILIAPTLADARDVMAVLVHEVCHTLPGCMNHGKAFAAAADAMGLVPGAAKGYKATSAGLRFDTLYSALIGSLGAYPHAPLNATTRKTQPTRMLKACCPACGYTIRLTQKWADKGLPICVCGAQIALA